MPAALTTAIQRIARLATRHPYVVIVMLLLAGVGPFMNKAVHIDDPLFVWAAAQIQKDPLHFYSFTVNWFGSVMPMTLATCNPPLTSYGLGLVRQFFGTGELALHGALLLVAFSAAAGVYRLAGNWCAWPLLATVLTMVTPVFLVSTTNIMCDIPMLAAWIWTVVCWEHALKTGHRRWYLLAMALAGLSVLTKYSAMTLLPLLPLLGGLHRRKLGPWLLWLLVPLGMMGLYELFTSQIYGQGLISAAAAYANQYRYFLTGGWPGKTVIGLVYLGGCLLPATLLAPLLWRRRAFLGGALLLVGIAAVILVLLQIGAMPGFPTSGEARAWVQVEMILMLAGGLHVLVLSGVELWRQRDVVTTMAALWIGSGFLFAAVLNWTVSSRSLLPLVAPVAILIVRRLERTPAPEWKPQLLLLALVVSGLSSLGVSWADAELADSGRTAARQIAGEYAPAPARLWFEGHCAFQYYLEPLGGQAVDYGNSLLQAGDVLVVPGNNSNLLNPPADAVELLATPGFPISSWLTTVSAELGSGFYGAGGCLPFVIAPVPAEKYYVYKVIRTFQFAPPMDAQAVGGSTGDDRLAATSYKAILRAHPEDARAHASLADISCRQGQGSAALTHYHSALRLQPGQAVWLNNLAWLLATSGDPSLRNGAEAVQHAEAACQLTHYQKTIFLGTLGAAYAEAGRFEDAMAAAQKACANATALGETNLLERNQELLALYQSHQPYHEPAEKLVPAAR